MNVREKFAVHGAGAFRLGAASLLGVCIACLLTVINAKLSSGQVIGSMCCFAAAVPCLAASIFLTESSPSASAPRKKLHADDHLQAIGIALAIVGLWLLLHSFNVVVGIFFGASAILSFAVYAFAHLWEFHSMLKCEEAPQEKVASSS